MNARRSGKRVKRDDDRRVAKGKVERICSRKGIKWQFVTPTAPYQNGCAEAMVKSCKRAIEKTIGDNKHLLNFVLVS